MIARQSIRDFDDLILALPGLAPPGVVPDPTLPAAPPPVTLLSPEALPTDPDHCAIIGVIDHAIPFAHPLLRTADGHSRVASVWVQDAPAAGRVADIPFGAEWTGMQIDAATQGGDEDRAYRAAGLMEAARPGGAVFLRDTSHGAAVTGLAAGFAPDAAMARQYPVLAVSMPDFSIADTSGTMSPLFIQAGVIFVIARARGLARQISAACGRRILPPVVVNLSLGITAGSPEGQSAIERLQDAIAAIPEGDLGPVHFVLATGNSRLDRLHGRLGPGQSVGWCLPPADPTPSALELWPELAGQGVGLRLVSPDGLSGALDVPPGRAAVWRMVGPNGDERLRVICRPPRDGRAALTLIAAPTQPEARGARRSLPGLWQVALDPNCTCACRLDIQRDDALPGFKGGGRQSRLVDPAGEGRDPAGRPLPDDLPGAIVLTRGTVSRYAGGLGQIRVGAATRDPLCVSAYAARLDDGQPGELLAIADRSTARPGVLAPGLRGLTGQILAGTSLAAPQATRWLAARLAAGDRPADRAAVVALARATGPCIDDVPLIATPE